MRKRDKLSKEKQEYIQNQFSKEKTETHFIKFERNKETFFSTQEGLQFLNNRDKIYFICEVCGEDILGGLRSACTYTGAENLKGLPRCTTFIRVNRIK